MTELVQHYSYNNSTFYKGKYYGVPKEILESLVESGNFAVGNTIYDIITTGDDPFAGVGVTQEQRTALSNQGFIKATDKDFYFLETFSVPGGTGTTIVLTPYDNIGDIELIGYAGTMTLGTSGQMNGSVPYGSDEANPTVQAMAHSIKHAVMGALSNKKLFLYALSKGYVYSQSAATAIGNIFGKAPQGFLESVGGPLGDIVKTNTYPPFVPGDSSHFVIAGNNTPIYSNCNYKPNQPCPGAGVLGHVSTHENVMLMYMNAPSLKPNIGTYYSPTTTLSKDDQKLLKSFGYTAFLYGNNGKWKNYNEFTAFGTSYNIDTIDNSTLPYLFLNPLWVAYVQEVEKYAPFDEQTMKPTWCSEWEITHVTDSGSPVYKSKLKINFESFFDNFLKKSGLIEYNEAGAKEQTQQLLNATDSNSFEDEFGISVGDLQSALDTLAAAGETTLEDLEDAEDVVISDILTGGSDEGEEGENSGGGLIIPIPTNSPFQQEIINNIIEKNKKPEEVFNIGPIYAGSTHYINDQVIRATKNGKSLSRSIMNQFTKYDKDGKARIQRVTNYEKDKYTSFTLPYGTTVKVVDEFINRPSGLYHMIQTVSDTYPKFQSREKFYIKAELLSKLSNTLPSLNTNFKNYAKSKNKIEWINMKDEEMFFDRRLLAYSIVVEPINPATGKKVNTMLDCQKTINDLENLAMRHGIEALMKCYNKKFFVNDNVSDTLDHLIDGVFQFAYTGENVLESKKGLSWYLDPRPKSKLKFIVRVPAKYFDALSEKPETFEDIPHVKKQLFTPEGQQPIDAAPFPSSGVSDFRVTSLLTCNIQHKIDMAVSIMKKYQEQIDAWDGEVEGLDLGLEIERLEAFPQTIQKFVVENNFRYRTNGEDELEIGCNSKFRLKYVSYVRAGLSKPLRICFNRFKKKYPVKFSRTMGYIYYLDDIIELERKLTVGASEQNAMNWVEFIQKYTYPMPAIRPSSRKATSPLASSTMVNKQDKAKKLAEKYNKTIELTAKSLQAQIKELSNPDLKLELASSRLQHKDFSGDVFVEKIPQLVEAIRNLSPDFDGLQNLFTLVFDKIDISALSSISAGSIAIDMPSLDIENAFSLAALESPEISGVQFDKIFNFLPEATINKVSLVESYFDGSMSISDIEGEFPDDVLSKILDFFDKKEQKQTPAGREAEIMKKGSLEDIKCLGLDTKYGTASPRLDDRQNTKKELIKMIALPQQLTSAISKVVPDIIKAMGEIGELSSKDVPSLSLSSLKKGAVKFPKPPTITIPRLPDIDDTMPNISKDLTAGLEQVLATVLIEISATLLESVFNSVFSSANNLGQVGVDAFPSEFGGQDINELLEDFNPANQNAVENAMKKLGIGPSTEQYDIAIDAIADEMAKDNTGGDTTTVETPKTSKQVISEISSVLTPLEVVDLLEGTPSSDALQVVEGLMGEGNQSLLDSINKTTSVKELFKSLGKLADPNKLEAIRNTVDQILPNPSGLLCEYENFNTIGDKDSPGDVIRRRALEGKLDKECVETQMSLIKQRKTERLANMLSLANGKDILAGQIPPLIGSCGKGIINKNHQTVEHMNEKLINAVFDPVKMSFSTEANTIGNSYTDSEPQPPTQFDDQYDALKASLFNANFMTETDDGPSNEAQFSSIEEVKDDFINEGFAEKLPKNQQTKFNNVASQFYVYDGVLAPKIRKIYTEKVALAGSFPEGPDTQFKLSVKYTELGVSEKINDLEKAKTALDSAITKKKNLDSKIASGFGNTSAFQTELDTLLDGIGSRTDDADSGTLFGKFNEQLAITSKLDPEERIQPLAKSNNIIYFTKDTEADSTKIVDTWSLSMPSSISKNIFASRFGTQGSDYKIQGYDTIDNIIPDAASEYNLDAGFNERDQVFANMLIDKWKTINPSTSNNATKDNETLNDFYRVRRSKLFRYFINVLGLKIPSSELFDGTVFSELDLGSGKHDANFDASGKCSPDKTDNILGIEDLKRQVREEYNNSCEDDEDSSKPGGIEKANLRGLMRATIRISILEAVSKGIFMGSIYSMQDMLKDPALIAFFVEMVKSDLLFQDNEYYEEFLVQAKGITDEKTKKGEKLLDPFTKKEDTKLIHVDDPRTQNGENSLRFVVREELKYLSSKIDERLKPQYKNVDNLFLQEMIPLVDVRRHYQQNIFHKPVYSKILDPDTETVGGNIVSDFVVKNQFSFIQQDNNLFNESGGFVLERYVRVEDTETLKENVEGLSQIEIDFVNAWHNRTGGINNENPEVLKADLVDVGKSKAFSYAYTSGAVNIAAFREALIKLLEENEIQEIELSKLMSNFKFGLRLVYIPPSQDVASFTGASQTIVGAEGEDLIGTTPIYAQEELSDYQTVLGAAFLEADDLLSEKNGFNQILEMDVVKGSSSIDEDIDVAAKKEKLFRVEEILGAFSVGETVGEFEDMLVNVLLTQNVEVKRLYPVEIVKVEDDYGIIDTIQKDNGKVNLQDLIDVLDDQSVLNTITVGLKQKLKESKEYKFAFHYDIPIRRALSLLFVHHNLTSVKNYQNITRTFSLSKDMLRSSFFNMIPGSMWWSKQDKRIEEQGGNSGMMETANNTMTADGPSGSDIAKKIAIQAAIIITKALAAQQDPNYALMKKLDTFGLTLGGMSWKSVPVLYPVNFPLPFPPFMGWGPPMTPLGMIAYSLPFLPGEAKKNKNKEQNKQEENSEC